MVGLIFSYKSSLVYLILKLERLQADSLFRGDSLGFWCLFFSSVKSHLSESFGCAMPTHGSGEDINADPNAICSTWRSQGVCLETKLGRSLNRSMFLQFIWPTEKCFFPKCWFIMLYNSVHSNTCVRVQCVSVSICVKELQRWEEEPASQRSLCGALMLSSPAVPVISVSYSAVSDSLWLHGL